MFGECQRSGQRPSLSPSGGMSGSRTGWGSGWVHCHNHTQQGQFRKFIFGSDLMPIVSL